MKKILIILLFSTFCFAAKPFTINTISRSNLAFEFQVQTQKNDSAITIPLTVITKWEGASTISINGKNSQNIEITKSVFGKMGGVPVSFINLQKPAGAAQLFEIKIEIGENSRPLISTDKKISQGIFRVLETQAINRENLTDYQVMRGKYLIIVPDVMSNYLGSLAEHKRLLGYSTKIVKTSDIGTSANDIKTYIQQEYENGDIPLEYVLLIGDVDGIAQMEAFYYSAENDVSDHPYTCVDGDDYISDIFIGRFSVDTVNELIVSMLKTINYEFSPYMEDPQWFKRGLSVGGNYSNIPPNPITPLWMARWVREKMLQYNYVNVDTVFYPPVLNGESLITESINQGAGIVSYRGWADANGWHYPEFHTESVMALQNGWMLPTVFSLVCNTGDFANNVDPCFGETWLRKGSPSNPGGGVAFFGPSDLHTSTKYNNAICGGLFRGLFDEGLSGLGQVTMSGKMELFRSFPLSQEELGWVEFYFHVYNILGDPSLQIWKDTPKTLTVDSPETIYYGTTSISVNVFDENELPLENALVSIIYPDSLITTTYTDKNGEATLIFDPIEQEGVKIGICSDGYIPVIKTPNFSDESSLFSIVNYTIFDNGTQDSQGNGDGMINPGEIVSIALDGKNFSSGNFTNISASIVQNSDKIEILENQIIWQNIGAGETVTGQGNFLIKINAEMSLAELTLNIENNVDGTINYSGITFPLNYYFMNIAGYGETEISDSYLPIENNLNFVIGLKNSGNFDAIGIQATLHSIFDEIEILDSIVSFLDIPAGESGINSNDPFKVSVSSSLAPGSQVPLTLILENQDGQTQTIHFSLCIGQVGVNDPTGPDTYGYFAYESIDEEYKAFPVYEWIEIDPDFGGNGELFPLSDDQTKSMDLPFEFQYYGEKYNEISICSNGWIAFGKTLDRTFRNWPISSPLGPDAMVSAFWDDLKPRLDKTKLDIFTKYDADGNRFIIQWSRIFNRYEYTSETPFAENFQIILNGNTETPTGDGEIIFQYEEVNDVDALNNFSTIGIENPKQTDGLELIYAGIPSLSSIAPESGYSIKFTTQMPEGLILSTKDEQYIAGDFRICSVFPNPFNPVVNVNFYLPGKADIDISIFDLKGRKVVEEKLYLNSAGYTNWQWITTNSRAMQISSGLYFIQIRGQIGNTRFFETTKAVLMR